MKRNDSIFERVAVSIVFLSLYAGLCWLLYWPFIYGVKFLYLIFKP